MAQEGNLYQSLIELIFDNRNALSSIAMIMYQSLIELIFD